ncbi:hypothetical protein HK104_005419, partial [Borealophlyctis nickersoniae]
MSSDPTSASDPPLSTPPADEPDNVPVKVVGIDDDDKDKNEVRGEEARLKTLQTQTSPGGSRDDIQAAKVAELEAQVKALTDKLSKQSQDHSEVLSKKNEIIDTMRVKLNRYEFAIKEAILFLAKPMLGYEDWLNGGGADSLADAAASAAGAVADATAEQGKARSRNASVAPGTSSSGGGKRSGPATSSPAQMAEKQQVQQSGDLPKHLLPAAATNLEIQCLECMRLALNYLRNAQASVHGLAAPGMKRAGQSGGDLREPPQRLNVDTTPLEDVKERDEEDWGGKPNAVPEAGPKVDKRGRAPSAEPGRTGGSGRTRAASTTPSTHDRRSSAQVVASQVLLNAATAVPDDDESDLATNKKPAAPTPSTNPAATRCSQCRELMLQRDHDRDTINNLKQDITTLANQLEEERANAERIQLSKDILDQELEELTAQLFDQANRMVIDEARMRDELENTNKQLQGELKEVFQKFHGREEELMQLKHSLRALEAAKIRSSSMTNIAGSISPLGSQNSIAESVGIRRGSIIRPSRG